MTTAPAKHLDFSKTIQRLHSEALWQYEKSTSKRVKDVSHQTFHALQQPIDFPPLDAAIVDQDRVALAIDPNVPAVAEVLQGVLQALSETGAGEIDIVLWDEASDETIAALQHKAGEQIRVLRHENSLRASLRYLSADESAHPIYLNRRLVDADFVLPITVGRPMDALGVHDLTGVFPSLADADSRRRWARRRRGNDPNPAKSLASVQEPSWLLGVQFMLSVAANDHGEASEIIAGTPDAIRKHLTPSERFPDEFPPPAPLVIASLDGDRQQQSWRNAARAISAASRYVQPGGTIVLWSDIDVSPEGHLVGLTDDSDAEQKAAEQSVDELPANADDDFEAWDDSTEIARVLARVAAEHRVLIHSRVEQESIESMGLAAIRSEEELSKLTQSFDACGVLRAAQFAG